MPIQPGRVTDGQRTRIRRYVTNLHRRRGTIWRAVGVGSRNKTPTPVATHVPYRRSMTVPGGLRAEPGVLELLTVMFVQVAYDVDLRAHDTLVDEKDGLRLQITAISVDVERRGSLIAMAQVNS